MTTFADMAARLDPGQFKDDAYTPVLREMIARVVEREAPIRDDLLVERIARAHGFKRSGRVIRDRVMSIARGVAHLQPAEPRGGAFIWPDAGAPESWARARYPATLGDVRSVEEIATAELGAALRSCRSDDPAAEAARRFGVKRLSAAARERLDRAAPANGHLTR